MNETSGGEGKTESERGENGIAKREMAENEKHWVSRGSLSHTGTICAVPVSGFYCWNEWFGHFFQPFFFFPFELLFWWTIFINRETDHEISCVVNKSIKRHFYQALFWYTTVLFNSLFWLVRSSDSISIPRVTAYTGTCMGDDTHKRI